MTFVSIRLDQPAAILLPAALAQLMRLFDAKRRLSRYPSRRRAALVHAEAWAAMHLAHRR